MQSLYAVIAYLPLGILLTACWLEGVSAYKKEAANQPGIITTLFAAAASCFLAIVVDAAVPTATMETAPGADAWPFQAPKWWLPSVFGILGTLLTGAAYTLKVVTRNKQSALDGAGLTGKPLAKARKAINDLQLGYWIALAGAAVVVLFTILSALGGHALSQAAAFLPIGVVVAVVWLELVSMVKGNNANQPAALSALFVAMVAAMLALLVSFLGRSGGAATAGDGGPEEEAVTQVLSITPAWASLQGLVAAGLIALAFALKARAKNRGALPPAMRGRAYSYQQKAKMEALANDPSPAGYKMLLFATLPVLAFTQLPRHEAAQVIAGIRASVDSAAGGSLAGAEAPSAPSSPSPSQGILTDLVADEGAEPAPPMEEKSPAGPPPSADAMGETGTMEERPPDDVAMAGEVADMTMEGTRPAAEDAGATMLAETTTPAPVKPEPEPTPEPEPEPEQTPVTLNLASIKPYDEGRYYVSQVAPILRSYCYDCHGDEKSKGGLRLHSPAAIREGGNGGAVVLAGNPERSSLYTLTTLGDDDPDVMPPKGKTLSKKQQAILKKWVLDGAHMNDGNNTSSIAVANTKGMSFKIDDLSQNISAPNPAVIQALEQFEIQFRGLSANGALIKVDYSHVPRANKVSLADLKQIAPNIYHLDLSGARISNQDLMEIGNLPNLHKLELNKTSIGDDGIVHLQGLTRLESLNLFGTGVTDEGLSHLENLKNLKKLYVFQTAVSKAGLDALQQKIPGLEVFGL